MKRPEMKFFLVLKYTLPSAWPKSTQAEFQNDSGSLGSVISLQNLTFGILNPAKQWIQNSFAENLFQIVLTAFTCIHTTTVVRKHRLQTVQTTQTVQTM